MVDSEMCDTHPNLHNQLVIKFGLFLSLDILLISTTETFSLKVSLVFKKAL
jgi:hypothetical protein